MKVSTNTGRFTTSFVLSCNPSGVEESMPGRVPDTIATWTIIPGELWSKWLGGRNPLLANRLRKPISPKSATWTIIRMCAGAPGKRKTSYSNQHGRPTGPPGMPVGPSCLPLGQPEAPARDSLGGLVVGNIPEIITHGQR